MFHVASSCVTQSVFLFALFHFSSCGFQVSCFETWTWKEHWWGLNPEPVFLMHLNLLCYPYTTGNCWWFVIKASYIRKMFHVSCSIILYNPVCISVCTVSYFKLRVSSFMFWDMNLKRALVRLEPWTSVSYAPESSLLPLDHSKLLMICYKSLLYKEDVSCFM